jgi:PleD family two-component response regulator
MVSSQSSERRRRQAKRPTADDGPSPARRAGAAGAPGPPASDRRNAIKILVADDDADMLDVTTYALRREGYSTVTATDGPQAVDR